MLFMKQPYIRYEILIVIVSFHWNSLMYLGSNFVLSLETPFNNTPCLSEYILGTFILNSLYYSR